MPNTRRSPARRAAARLSYPEPRVLPPCLENDNAVDSLLGNLQAKFFCQNAGDTDEWASKLLGERWLHVTSTNVGHSQPDRPPVMGDGQHSSGVSRSEQRRYYVEPSAFTTLKRGGALNHYQVESCLVTAASQFPGTCKAKPWLPYTLLTFNQR